MKRQLESHGLVILTVCASVFAGCAVRPQAMQAKSVLIRNQEPFSVSVKADDANEDKPFGSSGVPADAFAEAIRDSIIKYGLFRSVINTGDGDYLLEADIVKLDLPAAGFNMTVSMGVHWTLTRVSTGKVVYQRTTFKPYTATVGEAFAGAERMRLAEEGSARENIEDVLDGLSQLNLRGNE